MFKITTQTGARDCSGISRRDFLQVGALGMTGLTLPGLLSVRAQAESMNANFVRDKAVVLLYLSGGASHIETFNPNMDAPAPHRSINGETKTSLPGVTFGATFPGLAKRANQLAIVRSHQHPIGGHEQAHVHVLSGGTDPIGNGKTGFSMGSLYARLRGLNHEVTGLPTYLLLTHAELDGQYSSEVKRVVKGSWPGQFGPNFSPFRHHDSSHLPPQPQRSGTRRVSNGSLSKNGSFAADMQLAISQDQLDDRMALLTSIDRMKRQVESNQIQTTSQYQQQALDLILGSASKVFNLASESKRLVDKYDTSETMIGKKIFRKSNLGKQMLLARRLIENGAGFVTVHSAGWDMHADGNNPGMIDGMNRLGRTVDKAVSAFIDDLKDRELTDKILLVITGDFGRTPKINQRGGRDHWSNLGTLAMSGGGLPMGQVIGRSDRNNAYPATEPITPQMMMSTIMHTIFDVGKLRVARGVSRTALQTIEEHKPIKELVA
ncbi:MAG: DUF1501 domain-containing protein [Planctomycetaceae bacterium]|nr:DUF1501 domain-containing protein [Planctomycetaceae bacterium]